MQIRRTELVAGCALLASSLLGGCASTAGSAPPAADEAPEEARIREMSKLVLCRSGWFGTALECSKAWDDPVSIRDATTNRAIKPRDPWIGTVGVKSGVENAYEYGLGVCVPNPGGSAPFETGRTVGLGCWVTLDF